METKICRKCGCSVSVKKMNNVPVCESCKIKKHRCKLKDSLGDRMKRYESVTQSHLLPRTPAIIRLDGKAFHTYTKGCDKPFDKEN